MNSRTKKAKKMTPKERVLAKYPSASLWTEGGWYWVLLTNKDSAPGSLRNVTDAWADAARRANV